MLDMNVWLFVSAADLFVYLLACCPRGRFIPCRSRAEQSQGNAELPVIFVVLRREETLFLSRLLAAINTPVPMVFLSQARLDSNTTVDLGAIPRLIPCRRDFSKLEFVKTKTNVHMVFIPYDTQHWRTLNVSEQTTAS